MGMCCAQVFGKQGTMCVYRQTTQVRFNCLEGAKSLAASAAALLASAYMLA